MSADEIRKALFVLEVNRAIWLYKESVAEGTPNGWHLLRVVQLARDFGQPVPDNVRDELARAADAMLDGSEPAVALHLKNPRGGSHRAQAQAARSRAEVLRWLCVYMPKRLGGAVAGADERFGKATQAYAAASRIFGISPRTARDWWIAYRDSRK